MKVPMLDLPRQQQSIAGPLERAVAEVMRQARYLPDRWPTPFEEKLAAFLGRPFAVGTGSGSSALQIALLAAGIGPGSEVITVPNSFFATTEAILLCGAAPRFTDVDPETHLMKLDEVEALLTPRTRAILPVHLFGNVVDIPRLQRMLTRLGRSDVVIIEDCAHAAGAALDGRRVPLGSIGAFSFNPGKNIGALGDAGAIVTSEESIASAARLLRDHGRISKNEHDVAGFNSRLRSIDDAVLSLKLDYLEEWNERRRDVARQYDAAFRDDSVSPTRVMPHVLHARHQYVVRAGARDEVRERLRNLGVETSIHYPSLIVDQRPLRALGFSGDQFPHAARANRAMISIPCFPEMTAAEVDHVIGSLLLALRETAAMVTVA